LESSAFRILPELEEKLSLKTNKQTKKKTKKNKTTTFSGVLLLQ